MGRPTLYLTHVSVRRPGFVGPGRKWTIMALPRRWERQEGDVRALRRGAHRRHRGHRRDVVARRVAAGWIDPKLPECGGQVFLEQDIAGAHGGSEKGAEFGGGFNCASRAGD